MEEKPVMARTPTLSIETASIGMLKTVYRLIVAAANEMDAIRLWS
ncbi:hypothetical protein BCCH1_79730 (plasmid) [Burkholderia contaminans]|uniref:Uncharacterized protein n=1 Tax=Burkholderia contaminans TaxID=488447 RepID=A0A250LLP8_9BURK|nr:hypothetical protein BCCH1_79730 [Burkholderia contaminans]